MNARIAGVPGESQSQQMTSWSKVADTFISVSIRELLRQKKTDNKEDIYV
jgi:hypothetical protein